MLRIRLSRQGRHNRAFFRIVVIDQKAKARGRFKALLGYYNPVAKGEEKPLVLDVAELNRWVASGAQMTETVANLVKQAKKSAAATEAA